MKRYLLLVFALVNAVIAVAQKRSNTLLAQHTQTIHLIFKNVAGDTPLQNGTTYTNTFGEPFTVRAFKYYISNIQLEYAGNYIQYEGEHNYGKINIAPHLVNEADTATKHLTFTAPAGVITSIRFLLGVDSISNTTGVQTGDLDPAKGMYWVWNTGYIMAKLEGTSAVAKSPGHQFSYDIGGFKNGMHAARTINLLAPAHTNHETAASFTIKADILKWFAGVHEVKIGDHPMCHEPGTLAMQIADNYEHMFSISVQ